VPLDQRDLTARSQGARLAAEDHVRGSPRGVHDDDNGEPGRAQHAHHGSDAGAGRQEQHLRGPHGRQHEVAGRLVEHDDRADAGAAYEVGADRSPVHGLDRDRDAAVRARGVRAEGVRAPLTHAVDVDERTYCRACAGQSRPGRMTAVTASRDLGVQADDAAACSGTTRSK
jgi:hypothetical protein